MGEVKALFGRLVFDEVRPADHSASLACHLFLTVGSFLERTAPGRKLSDCMCARLRELKGINFSEETLFSLKHVTDLKLNKWVAKKETKSAPKVASVEKAARAPAEQDDKVLLIGKLFTEQRVATAVVKELFSQLLFKESVKENRVELACKLLSMVGPTLEASETGKKLVELVLLRMHDVKPGLAAVYAVSNLRANDWTPQRGFTFRAQACAAC
jgi:hypothetical protein